MAGAGLYPDLTARSARNAPAIPDGALTFARLAEALISA
jgi:hypothetical protein